MRLGFDNMTAPGDHLLSLAHLPSVGAHHLFEDLNGTPTLTVQLDFDPTRYEQVELPPKQGLQSWKNKALADTEIYRKASYQITQPDVTVSLATSLDSSKEHLLSGGDRKRFNDFVIQAYDFLIKLGEGDEPYPTPPDGQPTLLPDQLRPPADVKIHVPISATLAADIVELHVRVVIARDDSLVDSRLQDDELIWRASTDIPPFMKAIASKSDTADATAIGTHRLDHYAEQFESAYQTASGILKIAAGAAKDELSGAHNPLWVVRFSKNGSAGISAQIIGEPAFFAPRPLAKSLLSMKKVPVYTFNHITGGISDTPYQKKDFTGIDMDTWAQLALAAIDQFLEPQTALAASILDQKTNTNHLQDILDAKYELAEAIAGKVDRILQNPDINPKSHYARINNAQEQMRQQMLIKLAAACTVDAIVQYPVGVRNMLISSCPNSADGEAPRLFGVPVAKSTSDHAGTSKSGEDYTVSTFKIDLDDSISYLSYAFSLKRDRERAVYVLDLEYQVTHIEHQICPEPGIDDNTVSSRIDFVHPLEPMAMADNTSSTVTIPVLLRSYPSPPSVTSQEAVSVLAAATTAAAEMKHPILSAGEALQKAKRWDCRYTYSLIHAAQDRIDSNVTLNQPDDLELHQADLGQEPLFTALAQLVTVLEELQNEFATKLSEVTMDSKPAELKMAAPAVAAFAKLVKQLPDAWTHWLPPKFVDTHEHSDELATYAFSVEERNYKVDASGKHNPNVVEALGVAITPTQIAPDVREPQIIFIDYPHRLALQVPDDPNVFGYQNGQKQWLTWEEALKLPCRTVEFNEMNALQYQNAWSSVRIVRNKSLIHDNPTREDFVYQTPFVKFANRLDPLLDSSYPIDVASIGAPAPKNRALWQHLRVLFENLFDGAQAGTTQTVKLEAVYRYSLAPGDETSPIEMPMFLAPPFDFRIDQDWSPEGPCRDGGGADVAFVCKMADALKTWFASYGPHTDGAEFRFDVVVFSGSDGTAVSKPPLIQLRDIRLSVANITDLPQMGA
jgi:hypothetical protein